MTRRYVQKNDIFYEVSVQLGNSTELRVARILEEINADGPNWFLSWRRTEHYSKEDLNGIDFAISTKRGPILLQVKSSVTCARDFRIAHKDDRLKIVVIIVQPSEDDSFVRINLLHLLQERYEEL